MKLNLILSLVILPLQCLTQDDGGHHAFAGQKPEQIHNPELLIAPQSSGESLPAEDRPIYQTSMAAGTITIDGRMEEPSWNRAEVRAFENHYEMENPWEEQEASFRMLWDDQHLYLFYSCDDNHLTSNEKQRDGATYLDDCAEIFIIPVPDKLDTHIGFEINLLGTIYDFVYFNDYYEGKDKTLKSYSPEIEVEIVLDGTLNDNRDEDRGWTMEVAIPVSAFEGLTDICPVRTGSRWAFQAVRIDRNSLKSNHRSLSTLFPLPEFRPGSVHQVNLFGLMEFVE